MTSSSQVRKRPAGVAAMKSTVFGVDLRARLGEDGSRDLADFVEHYGEKWRADVITTCTDRFEGKLHGYAKQDDVREGFTRIVNQIADLRVEILRWSFAFWLGQVAVIVALMAFMVRIFGS